MAYKGKPIFVSKRRNYYMYSSEWTFLLLVLSSWILNAIILIASIIIFFTLTSNLLFNLFIAVFVFPFLVSHFLRFLAFFLLPVKEITEDEYEMELEKIEQMAKEKVDVEKNKKSFFERYKEYKNKKGSDQV